MASAKFSNHFSGYSVVQTRLLTSSFLLGTCASWMFLSFVIVQAFTYFRHYKNDSKFLKTTVYVIILLQLMQTGAESYVAYAVDSTGWGNPRILSDVHVFIVDDLRTVLLSPTAFIVQCFFTWRIWTFSTAFILHSKIRMFTRFVCVFIALVSALSLGTGFTLGISAIVLAEPPLWIGAVIALWFVSSAVADILTTIFMTALLLHARASSYFGETRDLLSRLTRLVLQTGLLTTVLALLVLPFYFKLLVGIYTLPWYILGKSYIISLLANLNARKRSNTSVAGGSGFNQATPATKLSAIVFPPGNRHTGEGGNSDSITSSLPVHSVVRVDGLDGSIINADESKRGEV